LRPTGGLWEALGRSAPVGRKLSHEQNHFIRTKVRPAPGKTTLLEATGRHLFEKKSVDPIIGNRSILMHFWIDLIIEPVYHQVEFFIFLHF
jgi:hypothetical protein